MYKLELENIEEKVQEEIFTNSPIKCYSNSPIKFNSNLSSS